VLPPVGAIIEAHQALGDRFSTEELTNAMHLQRPNIAEGTSADYKTYERKLMVYLKGRRLDEDPFLRLLPGGAQIAVLTQWLTELRQGGAVHANAFPALKMFFARHGESVVMFRDPVLKNVRAWLRPTNREENERRSSTTKVAASKEFVDHQKEVYWSTGIDGMMRVAAISYEFAYGTRVGNIGWDSKGRGKHMLMVKDVTFWLTGSGDGIPARSYELLGLKATKEECFMLVCTHVSGKNFGGKKGALINTLSRRESRHDGDLIDIIFAFAVEAHHSVEDFFFSRNKNGLNKKFTSSESARAVKESAAHFGLPPSVFSTTSWRAGSATAMAAEGFSDEYLKRTKKWSSDASLRYQRPTGQDSNANRVNGITLHDVQGMIPMEAMRSHVDTEARTYFGQMDRGSVESTDKVDGEDEKLTLRLPIKRAALSRVDPEAPETGEGDGHKWYGIYRDVPRVSAVTDVYAECNRLVSTTVGTKRMMHEGIHFKGFGSKVQANEFARNYRDLSVEPLQGPVKHANGSWSQRYWGIFRGIHNGNTVTGFVTNSEAKMRALTIMVDE